MTRKRIYQMLDQPRKRDALWSSYHLFMLIIIMVSLVPLAFKEEYPAFEVIDTICVIVFLIDYFLRWITADFKFKQKGIKSFLKYPFSPMAILDLITILPSISFVYDSLQLLRILRVVRVFRVFKTIRYSATFDILRAILKESKRSLIAVFVLAGGYILISALIIFNVEPESFQTFFDAVYWATMSLTTVGYGDIYPVSTLGRLITMISSILGIAVVALPAGIVTAGYMNELRRQEEVNNDLD